ncbi:hypothetical protein HNQ85_002844 [Anoxybacillus calidus]|jgi:Domain of unknown function (DUF4397)|uniref:DUF4397 domain-containing protein n=1 Tax=[Anoxybacillus] calidus TaxID=575178 RepID=A0A7V9Z249_9BACL|nr:DUF4397 domain-containing protein [Anoxybacillus calidus]MBA2872533.1 hypothetical protein [Anoxybacillus calidus]
MHHYHEDIEEYAQKAVMYDLLACYYKYTDPNKYMMHYQKHYEYMKKLAAAEQVRQQEETANLAMVRIFHASSNAPAVDVYVNGQKVLQELKYKQISQYLKVPTGQYRIDIYPSGRTTSPVLSEMVYILPSLRYTIAGIGNANNLQLLPFFDNPYVSYGETKVRLVHLSPNAPAVDIAVKGGNVLFKNVRYKEVSDYVKVSTNQKFSLEVRIAGTDNVVLTVPNVRLGSNKSYTIVTTEDAKDTFSLEVILIEE